MAKVAINIQTPIGYLVARAINNLQKAAEDLARAEAAAAMALGGAAPNNTLDTGSTIGTALFGGAAGSSGDYAYALSGLNSALQTFITNATNSGFVSTLDNGDIV